jgi:sugar phosphate permease
VPVGGALAALTLPVCLTVGGLHAALAALAAVLFAAAVAGGVWLRDPARPPAESGSERPPLADPRIWRLCWASGLLYVALGSLIGFAVLFLHSERGVSTPVAAAMLAAVQVNGAALRLVAGSWSDRAGTRVGPLRRLGLALAAASAVVAVLVSAPLLLLVPALVIAGSLSQSWNGLSFTAAAEMSGRDRAGTAMGLQNTLLTAAGVATPLAFAALVGATSWPAAFALLTLCPLAGLAVLAPLREEERERRAARARRMGVPATVSVNPS